MPHVEKNPVEGSDSEECSDISLPPTEPPPPEQQPAKKRPRSPPPTQEEIDEFFRPVYDRAREERIHDMEEPLTASWGVDIADADVEKLKAGFRSRCNMDQKWDLLVEDPDSGGNGGWSLHIIRNWLYDDIYVLHIVPNNNTGTDGKGETGAKIESITWESSASASRRRPEEQAKMEAIMVVRGWLGAEIASLPEYSWDLMGRNYEKLDVTE
ncbi:hypothetical protein MAPG_04018 [Magnaporthiopsis poae ATCC 64411]|uniref:Uncharacterized protein n=1 Tax=Magnaporthiopsis poae (strain ATCC 64411 / 73-15) TaxID=644358 RepID=A0A0C4DVL1_MAGP6|nr:hypothetical protein MAPG_04018 [Magnaporthiopsis poae ATCC 64411]